MAIPPLLWAQRLAPGETARMYRTLLAIQLVAGAWTILQYSVEIAWVQVGIVRVSSRPGILTGLARLRPCAPGCAAPSMPPPSSCSLDPLTDQLEQGLIDLHSLRAWVAWLGLEAGDPSQHDTGHLQRLLAWKVLVLVTVAAKRRSLKYAGAGRDWCRGGRDLMHLSGCLARLEISASLTRILGSFLRCPFLLPISPFFNTRVGGRASCLQQ